MRRLFADTGYWIALIDSSDNYHERTKSLSLKFNEVSILTTNLVLVEFLINSESYRFIKVLLIINKDKVGTQHVWFSR